MKKFIALLLIIFCFSFTGCNFELVGDGINDNGVIIDDGAVIEDSTIDYPALMNEISTSTIKANLTVYNRCYNKNLGWETSYSISQGSGFIFKKDENNYYLLTNNHVVVAQAGFSYQKFTVKDYAGNEYIASLRASNPDYDVALISFEDTKELNVLDFASVNPDLNIDVVSLGQPNGQANAITFGKVQKYQEVTLSDATASQSNVTFPVIAHNAPINNGSSGGALLNTDLKIVGLNYAGSNDSENNFVYGYAVPVEKIMEFFQLIEFEL